MPRIDGSTALARFRVLDLTRVRAGPSCVRQLADFGADVIKIEATRQEDMGGPRDGPDFQNLHRNKRSITLNLKAPQGRDVFLRLVTKADVVVENFRPDVKDRLGIDYESLRKVNRRIVLASVSGFGQDGPYRDRPGFDQIAQGMSGLMSVTGTERPTRVGVAIGDVLAGIFAAYGIALALYHRQASGEGQEVTTSLLEALVGVLSWSAGIYFATGSAPPLAGNHHPLAAPYGVFRARDRAFNIACGNQRQWQALCRALGVPELLEDERFAVPLGRVANRTALTARLENELVRRDAAEWVTLFNQCDIPSGPINDMADVFADPQVQAREMYVELPHAALGVLKTTGVPVKLSASPGAVCIVPPELGADTDAVLAANGFSADEIAALRGAGVI
jgi:crotonobetainyl-CoA:carnitine CoA-transferase CaiB-like acyl-CoA transferase